MCAKRPPERCLRPSLGSRPGPAHSGAGPGGYQRKDGSGSPRSRTLWKPRARLAASNYATPIRVSAANLRIRLGETPGPYVTRSVRFLFCAVPPAELSPAFEKRGHCRVRSSYPRSQRHQSRAPCAAVAPVENDAYARRVRSLESVHELSGEVRHLQRGCVSFLGQIGARPVPPFGHFVEQIRNSVLRQAGGKFPRVLRTHPIIGGCRPDERLRIFEERHLHVHRVPQLGVLSEFHAHQEPPVRASLDSQSAKIGDPARNEVARDRGEVIVDDLAMSLESGLMPGRSKLPAAADIRKDVDPTLLQPTI